MRAERQPDFRPGDARPRESSLRHADDRELVAVDAHKPSDHVQIGAASGKAPYREPDSVFAFLDWQFLPKLSLVATQGNRGTSILDVLFQHRY